MGFIRIYQYVYVWLITKTKSVGEIISGQEIFLIERVKLHPLVVRIKIMLFLIECNYKKVLR